jgi:long-chain acyl-CoA synthetase
MTTIFDLALQKAMQAAAGQPDTRHLLNDLIVPSERLAFVKDGDRWTQARLTAEAARLAAGLAGIGVQAGDRIALHLRNGPEIALAYLACFQLGAIAAPLNLRFKTAELEDVLRRLRPAAYIGHAELYRLVSPIGTEILGAAVRYVVGEPEDGLARRWTLLHRHQTMSVLADPDPDEPALLLSTSGSTGQPKLVAHSQATLASIATRLTSLNVQAGDVVAFFMPMVHASGLVTFLTSLLAGASLVMLDANDPDGILDAVEAHSCTYLAGLPTMLAHLMSCQRHRPRNMSSLRVCRSGGDVPLPGQQEKFPSLFGVPLRNFWASTEGAGSFTYGLRPGAVSRPIPGVEIRLVDADDRPVARGAPGEMLLRGPHIALGYWTGPGEWGGFTDGWYRTGDIMREDEEGNFWFISRAKDLIVRGGSNISPVEVEQVLASHPGVRDAAVAGVPDPLLGQKVVGFVQLAEGVGAERLEEILHAASLRLADYKLPERLLAVASIPRNGLGKIDRAQLARIA